jgi:hypothetical protein
MPAGGQRGVQVVIQQSPGRLVCFGGVVGGGQAAGVLAEQVVQLVAAGAGSASRCWSYSSSSWCRAVARLVPSSAAAA